jgi:hypothetical protein
MPYDAESNAGLRNDNNNRARVQVEAFESVAQLGSDNFPVKMVGNLLARR